MVNVMSNEIKKRFESLRGNYTPVNVIQYFDFLKTQPFDEVLENINYVFVEPTKGISFIKESLDNLFPHVSIKLLDEADKQMTEYCNKALEGGYSNTEHLESIQECVTDIRHKLGEFMANQGEYLRENTIENLLIMNNPRTHEIEVMDVVEEGLFSGEKKKAKEAVKAFIHKSNNDFMMGVLNGGPMLSDYQKDVLAFIRKHKDEPEVLKRFESSLKGERVYCVNHAAKLKGGKEHIQFINTKAMPEIEKSIVTEHIGSMAPDIVYADNETANVPLLKKKLQLDFAVNFVDTFLNDSDEVNLESFNAMIRAGFAYDNLVEEQEILTEGVVNRVAKKAAIAGDSAARKAANGMRRAGNESKRVKVIAKKIPGHFDKLADNTLGQIGKMDKAERRKRIIEGGFKFKLLKLVRNGILLGAAWAVSPALAAIGIITNLILDRQLDRKVRGELLDDLELELKMTREKIKDAESKNDNKKKYQLMRIENALERDIERVRYRLNTVKVSKKGVSI